MVRLLVEVLEPYEGWVYDRAAAQAACSSRQKSSSSRTRVAATTWPYTAKSQMSGPGDDEPCHSRHYRDLSTRWADTFREDKHPDLKADFILANPPFNMSDWARDTEDKRWRFGTPPAGNANFAWLQHIISKLGERCSAGVVVANGSMSSRQSGEGEIRAAIVEADLLACMIALPGQLFRTTQIPACLWFLTKSKAPQPPRTLADRRGQTLFIDARNLGTLINRTDRVCTDGEIAKIASTYQAWRGTVSARSAGLEYEAIPGFCYSAMTEEIRRHDHVLTPGRYVGATEVDDSNDEPIADKIARLTNDLHAHFDESAQLEQVIRAQLERLGV